jgi:hypothetical protein
LQRDEAGENRAKVSNAPALQGNSSRIVFTSYRANNIPKVWIMEGNGANPINRTGGLTGSAFDIQPTLSTNGRIAFITDKDGNFELYTINADGTNLQRVTNTSIGEAYPTWSPNGAEIVFVDTLNGGLSVIRSSAPRILTTNPLDYYPTWSPDGSLIAFARNNEIYTMSAANGAGAGDDVNEVGATFDPASATVWLGNGGSTTSSFTGLRFTHVPLPPARPSLPPIWRSIPARASGIPSASNWPPTAHSSNVAWQANTWYALDEIASVLQEVVNRPGWHNGHSLALILRGTSPGQWGRKFVMSCEGNPAFAPRLVVSYTGGASPTATPTPSGGTFPGTSILDTFNRANGGIGVNWSGATASYAIVNNRLHADDGDLHWNPTPFGPNQAAYVTLTAIHAASTELDLLLKGQSATHWGGQGTIEVCYPPVQQRVQHGADIPVTFQAGDQFGARATADGTVAVYRNGTLLGVRSITSWPHYASGGYIGLWFMQAAGTV